MRKPVPAKQQTGRVGQLLFVAQQAAQALAIERWNRSDYPPGPGEC